MSTREFFNIRYSFPGYIFVGIILLMNFKSLLNLGNSNLLIGIVSILSGGPIGFIICQSWYLTEEIRREGAVNDICGKLENNDIINIIKKSKFNKKVVILDFLSNQYTEKDTLMDYITRRSRARKIYIYTMKW